MNSEQQQTANNKSTSSKYAISHYKNLFYRVLRDSAGFANAQLLLAGSMPTMVLLEGSVISLNEFFQILSKADDLDKLAMLTKLYSYNPHLLRTHGISQPSAKRGGGRRTSKGTKSPPPAPPPTPALPQPQTFTHVSGATTIHATQLPGLQSTTGAKPMDTQAYYCGPLYSYRGTGATYTMTPSMAMMQQQQQLYNNSMNNTASWTASPIPMPTPPQLAADEKVIIFPTDTPTPRGPNEGRPGEVRIKFYVGGRELSKGDSMKSVPDTSIIPSIEDSSEASEIDFTPGSLRSPGIKEVKPAPIPMAPHLAVQQPKKSIRISVNNVKNKNRLSEDAKQSGVRNNASGNQVRSPVHFTNNRSKVVPIPVKPKIPTMPVQSVPFITTQQTPLQPTLIHQNCRSYHTLHTQVTEENRMGQSLRDVHITSGTPRVIVAPELVTESTPMRFIDVHSGATSVPIGMEQESFGLNMTTVPITPLAPEPKMVTVMPVQVSDEPDDYKPAESIDWEELNSVPLTAGYWPSHMSTRVAVSPLSMLKRSSYQKKKRHRSIVGNTSMSRMSLFRGFKRTYSAVESSEEAVDPNEHFHENKRRRLIDSGSVDEPATALLDLTLSSQRSQYQAEHVASPEYPASNHNFNSHENDNDVPEDEPLVTKRKTKIRLVPKVTAEQSTLLLDSKDEEEDNDVPNTNRYSAIEEQQVASPPVIAPSMEASDPMEIQSIEMDAPPSQVTVMTEPKDEEKEAAKRAKEEQDAQEAATDNSTSDKSQVDNEAFVKMLVGFIDIEDKIKAKQEELNGMFAEFEKKRGQIEQALDPALRNQILRSIRALAEEQKK